MDLGAVYKNTIMACEACGHSTLDFDYVKVLDRWIPWVVCRQCDQDRDVRQLRAPEAREVLPTEPDRPLAIDEEMVDRGE